MDGVPVIFGGWELSSISEGPLGEASGSDQIDDSPAACDASGDGEAAEGVAAVEQDKEEAGNGEEWRQRVEGDAEGTREVGSLDAHKHHADLLQEKL